ncbi:WhiB family transcriptional regulator [Pseudonocardia sp. N23]|uniref:WhiB family transcriptional regulator n=1 Tax=Pseudonocardia sp. N23 TaxID=1987376 RepID=UPI0011455962
MNRVDSGGTPTRVVRTDGVKQWRDGAVCRSVDPELFFPVAEHGSRRSAAEQRAKQVCARCPVLAPCLAWALAELPHGVAGGLNEQERSSLRSVGADQPSRLFRPLIIVPVVYAKRGPSRGELIEAGRRAIADGVPRDDVAEAFGVSRRTVDRWAASSTEPGGRARVAEAPVEKPNPRRSGSRDAAHRRHDEARTKRVARAGRGGGEPGGNRNSPPNLHSTKALAGNTALEGLRG